MGLAEIGVIGGSGLYRLLSSGRELTVGTPYGPTSDVISVAEFGGRTCAFLPRHGRRHQSPPHAVPYRANIFALKELGVTQIIGVSAMGAVSSQHKVGDFVLPDQLVDCTHGHRVDTFYDGPLTTHIGFTEPYCPLMRQTAISAAKNLGHQVGDGGTVVVTNGPRFSTKAESEFYARQGWHLENMTQYPEAVLARELTLSYMCLGIVTNSHVEAREGRQEELAEAAAVIRLLKEQREQLVRLLKEIVNHLPDGDKRPQFIKEALNRARWV